MNLVEKFEHAFKVRAIFAPGERVFANERINLAYRQLAAVQVCRQSKLKEIADKISNAWEHVGKDFPKETLDALYREYNERRDAALAEEAALLEAAVKSIFGENK